MTLKLWWDIGNNSNFDYYIKQTHVTYDKEQD